MLFQIDRCSQRTCRRQDDGDTVWFTAIAARRSWRARGAVISLAAPILMVGKRVLTMGLKACEGRLDAVRDWPAQGTGDSLAAHVVTKSMGACTSSWHRKKNMDWSMSKG